MSRNSTLITVVSDVQILCDTHDHWTELLEGTRYLLDIFANQNPGKIQKNALTRLVLISAYQLTEIMFFHQLRESVKSMNSDALLRALESDIERISFDRARNVWPKIVTDKKLPFGEEPLQSMKRLGELRNSEVHHKLGKSKIHRKGVSYKDIGESALFTAIEASKTIYEFFKGPSTWRQSSYWSFVNRSESKSSKLINALLPQ